jgi:hypothetical protein
VAIFACSGHLRYGTEGDVRGLQKQFLRLVTRRGLSLREAEACRHFLVEKTFTGAVGLEPFAVDDELWDGALAGAADDFLGGAGSGFDVDLLVGDLMLVEETLGDAAVGAPEGRVEGDLHAWVLMLGSDGSWP